MSEEQAEYDVGEVPGFTPVTEAERVCSIPNVDLMNFMTDLKAASICPQNEVKERIKSLVQRWKAFKTALNIFSNSVTREKVQRAKAATAGSITHAATFENLESIFNEIEATTQDANEVFTLKLKAFKEHGVDLLQLARALDAMVKDGKVDAAKLSIQLVGLLTEHERAEPVPVFNFNTIIVENPEQLKRMVG